MITRTLTGSMSRAARTLTGSMSCAARTLTGCTSRIALAAGRGCLAGCVRSHTRATLVLTIAIFAVLGPATPAFAAPETPEVSVESVTAGSATLRGVLNPLAAGLVEGGGYQFVYRPSSKGECEGAGEVLAPASPGLALGLPQEQVFESVGGLSADTEYAACVVVRNLKEEPSASAPVTFTTAIPPETPEAKPAGPVSASEASLHGVLNPAGSREAEPGGVEFRYRQSPSECQGGAPGEEQAVGPETAPLGRKEEPVEAKIAGLRPGRDYTYCVIATNNAGEASAPSASVTFTTPGLAATVEGESSSQVSPANATVQAQVNPGGIPTTYRVEYGTSTAYGSSTPETSAGDATGPVGVTAQLSGLEPGALYHYRFIVSNALGTQADSEGATFTTGTPAAALGGGSCPNEASRKGPSAVLPDCRAYEQVTPVDKGGAQDLFPTRYAPQSPGSAGSPGYPSENGDQFLFSSDAELDEYGSSGGHSVYLFSRGADGWTVKSLVEPALGVQTVGGMLFDPADFSVFGLALTVGSLGGENGAAERPHALLAGPADGPYTTIFHYEDEETENTTLAGGSADLSHVVLESHDQQLAPGDSGQDVGSPALYEWVGGQLKLVNVETDGSLISSCGAMLGLNQGAGGGTHGAVSSDGSKIFFTAPDPFDSKQSGCWGGTSEWGGEEGSGTVLVDPPQLYMRVDGASTVNVSAPATDAREQTPYPAVYVGASADGEKVFFLSRGELTADAVGHAPELFEYDTKTGVLTRVSRGVSGTAEGDVVQVPAISSDGSTVYFTAHGQLAPGAPETKEGFRTGQVDLYRYDTVSETTTYIAKIAADEYPSAVTGRWYNEEVDGYLGSSGGGVVGLTPSANWYTTADGQYLAFASDASLTGYDNAPADSGVRCELLELQDIYGSCAEVYLYSAASGRVVCVSCDPGGARPVGSAEFARSAFETYSGVAPRPVSEDGSYVFFDSEDALVAGALSGVLHVYEWHNGKVSLVSPGGDPSASFFLGSSASGGDVFFGTHAQLVAGDIDQAGDVYDARVDGGFEGLAPPACTGTGCQGVPGAPPIFATPASVTFAGIGNFPSEPPPEKTVTKRATGCRDGFRRAGKKGRCVKRRKPKRLGKSAHSDRRASR